MDEGSRRVEQIEHRVQMLLGIFAAYGVLPLEFKPADTIARLLVQHLRDLEAEAEAKGAFSKCWPITSHGSTRFTFQEQRENTRAVGWCTAR